MATKNKTTKSSSTAITKWDEELAKHAAEVAGAEQTPSGNFIGTRGGMLTAAGQPLKENKLRAIIIDHIYENAAYEGEYDSENPQPPVCYAFGRTEDELKPHEKSSDPKHEQCTGCALNEFGSAEKGKGKACKNIRRLALLSADGLSADSVRDGEIFYMKLPVTSVKGWAFYVKGLNSTMKRPPFGVITEIGLVPDANSQFKVTFTHVENVPNEVVGALMARREKVMQEITFPYGTPSEDAPKKGAAKGKGGKGGKAPAKVRKF